MTTKQDYLLHTCITKIFSLSFTGVIFVLVLRAADCIHWLLVGK